MVKRSRLRWFRFKEQAINGRRYKIFKRAFVGEGRDLFVEVQNHRRPQIPSTAGAIDLFPFVRSSRSHKFPHGAQSEAGLELFTRACTGRALLGLIHLNKDLVRNNPSQRSPGSTTVSRDVSLKP